MMANHPFAKRSLNVLDEWGRERCSACGRTRDVHREDPPPQPELVVIVAFN